MALENRADQSVAEVVMDSASILFLRTQIELSSQTVSKSVIFEDSWFLSCHLSVTGKLTTSLFVPNVVNGRAPYSLLLHLTQFLTKSHFLGRDRVHFVHGTMAKWWP